MKELVSIGIPAYKASFLKETIESVLTQTYSNFELIIVNDNSPEDIDSIVSYYRDSRIKYFKNKENLGKKSIVHNWNKCLSYANGKYFALLCDDDIMHPSFISTMVNLACNNPNCNVFKTRTRFFNQITNNFIGESSIWPKYESYNDLLINTIKGNRKHTISEFFYRTQHIKKCNGYITYPVGYYADDHSILIFSKEGGIITNTDCLITFRKSKDNISTNIKYNLGKTMAALQYYYWLKKQTNEYKLQKKIKERLDFDLYEYAYSCKHIFVLIYILCNIPNEVWNIKQKLGILYQYIQKQ